MNSGEQDRGRDAQRPTPLAERRARRGTGRKHGRQGAVHRDTAATQTGCHATLRAARGTVTQREYPPSRRRARTTSVDSAPVWRRGAVASGGCPALAAVSALVAPNAPAGCPPDGTPR